MKVISFILAIYVLALSFVPCADGLTPEEDRIEAIAHHDHDEGEDHSHSDGCSPFCHCNCCQTVALYSTSAELENVIIDQSISFPDYMSHPDHIDPDKLFQPPRV